MGAAVRARLKEAVVTTDEKLNAPTVTDTLSRAGKPGRDPRPVQDREVPMVET